MSKRKRKNRPKSHSSSKSKSTTAPVVLNAPPLGQRRQLVRILILTILAVNLLVPLKWYLAPFLDAEVDERFTWRMFSAFSMRRTQISLTEDIHTDGKLVHRKIELPTIVQPSWAELLQKYHQPALVEHLLQEHCRQTSAESATFTRTGTWSDGTTIKPTVITVTREDEP